MRRTITALGFLVAAVSASPASASVTYDFDTIFLGFSYVAPSFITSPTSVDASSLASCGAFLSTCSSVDFAPKTQSGVSTVDEVSFNGAVFGIFPFTQSFDFENGAFSKAGHYVAVDGFSTLDVSVSSVPLPASAPLFGAALLGLAGVGYVASRKQAAAAA